MATAMQQLRSWLSLNPIGRRLLRRLLVWFGVFSLIPLVVTNTVGYLESQRIIERLVYRYMHALAEVEANHVRDQIERQRMALGLIATGNEFLAAGALAMSGQDAGPLGEAASQLAVRDYLTRKLHDLGSFESLRLYSTDARVLVTALRAGGRRSDIPGMAREGFFVLHSRRPYEPPRFHVVVPVQREARTVGYLAGIIGSQQLHAFLEIPPQLAGGVNSVIVDEEGHPLFVSDSLRTTDFSRPHPISIQPTGQAARVRYEDRMGTRLIAASAAVKGTPWTFVTEVPESSALGPLWTLRKTSAWLEAIFIVLLAFGAWLVARSIVTPVRQLVAAARRVAQGDLTARVEVTQADELGELGQTFNDMTAELDAASARVQQLHQQQIERAQQLATVGELASGVAHEIKNPVVGISNGLDLVQRRLGPDPVLAPIMDEMTRQIARIDSAVRDLLSFARPSKPTLMPIAGNRVLTRALRLVQPAASNAGIDLKVQEDPHMPLVQLDEELITQALVNVMMNAVQATAPGGRIVVRSRVKDGSAEFTIRDTGKGIVPEDLEHIYKPFFTTKHSGTGLGLSITRDIVEQHGGRIKVQSRTGRGSKFSIVLPIHANTAALRNEVTA